MERGVKRGTQSLFPRFQEPSWIWISRHSPVPVLVGPYGGITVYLWLIELLAIEC